MLSMNQRLPLPNPDEWMTANAAAAFLKVHPATIGRMIRGKVLTGYSPVPAVDERPPVMLWAPEVEQLREARRVAGLQRG